MNMFQIVKWAAIVGLAFHAVAFVLGFLGVFAILFWLIIPRLLLAAAGLCSVYALMPPKLRVPAIERWLNPNLKAKDIKNTQQAVVQAVPVGAGVGAAPSVPLNNGSNGFPTTYPNGNGSPSGASNSSDVEVVEPGTGTAPEPKSNGIKSDNEPEQSDDSGGVAVDPIAEEQKDNPNPQDDLLPPPTPPQFNDEPEEEEMPKPLQPELNFAAIRPRIGGKLPTRDELRNKIQAKVIGQKAAVDTLVRVVLGKLAAEKNPKPLVVFLPGPTGTGKTEISKALAEALGTKLVRFDMGEYAESHSSSNLFGSPKGYVGSTEGGALPNALRQSRGRCVLLFDEVEKANQGLWRQLLAFFDEGRAGDSRGQAQAPKNTICMLTSNLDAEKIAKNPESAKDILKHGGYFPPEFLGRIDKIIPLLTLSGADLAQLTVLQTKRLADRFGINLIIEQEALEELVSATYEEANKFGGRGIMERVSDLLTDDLLDLQCDRVSHARLIVENERVKAVPIGY